MKKKIILLAGPTASGKTKIAIKLAKSVNGEIINADSMQVYKDFEILSSRPSRDEIILAKHHLYGFQSSGVIFSTGKWLKLAAEKIIMNSGNNNLVLRTNVLYDYIQHTNASFLNWVINSLKNSKPINVVTDQINNPTWMG